MFAVLGIVKGENVILHLLGHGAGLLYSILHAVVQVSTDLLPLIILARAFCYLQAPPPPPPLSFWRQRKENLNVRKGDFPTDGIVKKNLKSLQNLGQKKAVPRRAKATVCAYEYNCVQWDTVCAYIYLYILLSIQIYLKYFDLKSCFLKKSPAF